MFSLCRWGSPAPTDGAKKLLLLWTGPREGQLDETLSPVGVLEESGRAMKGEVSRRDFKNFNWEKGDNLNQHFTRNFD